MKLYTKKGDDGQTSLFGEGRVSKDHIQICAYGEIDELNSSIGVAIAHSSNTHLCPVYRILTKIQPRIFDLGTDLCTPENNNARKHITPISEEMVEELEKWIDEITEPVPKLQNFILPGGTIFSAHIHHSRTICRRVERTIVSMNRQWTVNPYIIKWINRLSDLLFALARYENHINFVDDIIWSPYERLEDD